MYDRAPRDLTVPAGSTAHHVGPGAYDTDAINYKKIKADGYAPFASMTNRESVLNPTDTVIAAPGPGQYDPIYPQDVIKGGKTMANRSQRFDNKSGTPGETPGPGAYSLSKQSDWLRGERVGASSAPSRIGEKKHQSMLLSSRIKYHRKPIAPSIPTPGQAYGYEENDDGSLRKQDAPDKDKSMGPAYYNVAQKAQTYTTEKYKGIHFGNQTSKRMDFCGKEGPGPGEYEAYEPEVKLVASNINNPDADRVKMDAKLPRYHELVVKEEERKAVPGPGKYEIRGQFDDSPPKVNTEGIEVEHPPFGSQQRRFTDRLRPSPAPGTYNDPRTALDSLKRVTGLKRSPFGQTSVRFVSDGPKRTPGPGQYNIPGLGADSMKKAYIESTRRGVFGTTSVRIAPMTKKGEPEVPGPSHYQVSDQVNKPRYKQLSSNFASLSNRLSEPPPVVKDLPPPGSYEVERSYSRTQTKQQLSKPRSDSAKKKMGAFQSSSSRFAPPRDVVLVETDPGNPGPGSYDPKKKGRIGNPMITKDGRFKHGIKEEIPGPGAYEFSPLIQDTVLKGTFNATLNNPIAGRLEPMGGPAGVNSHPFLLGV